MSLLQQAPRLGIDDAVRLAHDLYAIDAAASALPSERDQNFLLVAANQDRFVLKVANGAEDRAMLEAQNAAMTHVSTRVPFCPRVLPAKAGGSITATSDGAHLVRLVTYLPGVPWAEAPARTATLLDSLGRAVGRLDRALDAFDHPAIHRRFHWDLANAADVIDTYLPLVHGEEDRHLVQRVSRLAFRAIGRTNNAFRRSAVHHDANDWNVLVRGDAVVGLIDFGDMVHGWTVADPAVAVAYALLDAADLERTTELIVAGYVEEYPLRADEREAVLPLAGLRLCMSVCIAAWQRQQRPDDDYLTVSQNPIRRTLPPLAAVLERRA